MNSEQHDDTVGHRTIIRGVRLIGRYMREHTRALVALSLLGVISALGTAVIPIITGRIIDELIAGTTAEVFGREVLFVFIVLVLWCVVQLVTYTVDWVLSVRSLALAERMSIGFRVKGYSHLLRLSLAFHKQERFGSVMENMNMGAFTIRSVTQDILKIAPQMLTLVAAFSFAFFINVWLATVLVISVALYLIIARSTLAPLEALESAYHKHQRDAYGTVYNVISQVREVKIAAYEEREDRTISRKFAGPLMDTFLRIRRIWERMSFFQRVLVLITQISIYVLGIVFVTQGTISVGDLVAFNAYAGLLYGPFIEFNMMWQWLQNYATNLVEAEKIFDIPQESYHPKGAIASSIRGQIEFDHVSFSYDERHGVLEDVSFMIPAGSRTALVGRSGEGKSTIIDLIAGFYYPTSGSVAIDGTETTDLDLVNLRRSIGVVSQEIALFNDTIHYNIAYGAPYATREDVVHAARYAHADEFIQEFPDGYDTLVGERGVKLSVGQKQRVAIARAYLQNPAILILDEPTSALDAKTEHDLTDMLEKLMKGRTTIIVAHRLSTVRRADQIVVLKAGRIVEQGTHGELIERVDGVYRELYNLQIGLHG